MMQRVAGKLVKQRQDDDDDKDDDGVECEVESTSNFSPSLTAANC